MAGRRRSQKTEYYFDYSLLFIILFLTGFGLVMIYSASAYDATTQNLNEDYYLMHQAFAAARRSAASADRPDPIKTRVSVLRYARFFLLYGKNPATMNSRMAKTV